MIQFAYAHRLYEVSALKPERFFNSDNLMVKGAKKPDTRTAMQLLIREARNAIPFGLPDDAVCGDTCQGCSSKLLIYLETELDAWEVKLADGAIPSFGELHRLAKQCRKIHRVLVDNGVPVTGSY